MDILKQIRLRLLWRRSPLRRFLQIANPFERVSALIVISVLIFTVVAPLIEIQPSEAADTDSISYDFTYTVTGSTHRYQVANASVNLSNLGVVTFTYPRNLSVNGAGAWTSSNPSTPTNWTYQTTVNSGRCGTAVQCATTTYTINTAATNAQKGPALQSLLNSLYFTSTEPIRGELHVVTMEENIVSWTDDDGNRHFYELINSGNSALTWSQAYNLAKDSTFHGLTGYLISMTTKNEADIILQYTTNLNLSAVGYTSGIRFRKDNTANTNASDDAQIRYPKVDGTIGYGDNPVTEMYAMPTGQNSIASAGFACTATTSSLASQGCTSTVAAVTSTAVDACPTSAAYDTEWYWANPVDNGAGFYSGRVYTECSGTPLKNTELSSYWNGAQPQGGEMIMAYSSASGSFGWHDYSNNAGSYYYVEYSEGWVDRGGGTFQETAQTNGIVPFPTRLTIHHVRAGTNEILAPDTIAPSVGLSTDGTFFNCTQVNGALTFTGYVYSGNSCSGGTIPYDGQPSEITYYYSHQVIHSPVPFQVQRTTSGSNYVYKLLTGSPIDDFGPMREVVITYPSSLTFSAPAANGFNAAITSGRTTISIPNSTNATSIATYLASASFTASGLTNTIGEISVQVSDYANTPANADPGRTTTTAPIPQPITINYYRLGTTTSIQSSTEFIGLVGAAYTITSPPVIANYVHYMSSPAVGNIIATSAAAQTVNHYYTPESGVNVTFDLGEHTSAVLIPDQIVPIGDHAVQPPNHPVVSGYYFTGWYTDNTCTTNFDFVNTAIAAPTTIYGCFSTAPFITVHFNSDSAAGDVDILPNPETIPDVVYNSKIPAPDPPILSGYQFVSWNTAPMTSAASCGGGVFSFADDFVAPPSGTTFDLYACFKVAPLLTVNFNTAPSPDTVEVLPEPTYRNIEYYSQVSPPDSPPVSEGYELMGWYTEPMSGTVCNGVPFDFDTYITDSLTNLYACWSARPLVRITFHQGSGLGNDTIINNSWPADITDMYYNSSLYAYGFNASPVATSHFFDYWCLGIDTNCAKVDRFTLDTRITEDIHLTANWRDSITYVEETTPNAGSIDGGTELTVTGGGFKIYNYDAKSYVAKEDMFIQLDALQNRRGTPRAPAESANSTITMTGNVSAGTSSNASDSAGQFWQDLACDDAANGWSGYANTTCENFIPKYTTNNQPTIIRNASGALAIHLNGNNGFQIDRQLNLNANNLWTGTSGVNSKMTTEIYVRQNAALTSAAVAVLFEQGTSATSTHSSRMLKFASAASTSNLNACFGNSSGSALYTNQKNGTWTCGNDTEWHSFAGIYSRATTTANDNTNTYWQNGNLAVTSAAGTRAITPTNNSNLFLGVRNMTTTNGTSNLGSARFNGEIRTYRMYRRALTGQELQCNMWVDQARYEGKVINNIESCYSGATDITGTGITPSSISIPIVQIGNEEDGYVDCQNINVVNDTQLTCTVPATMLDQTALTSLGDGYANVLVTTGSGNPYVFENGFYYQAPLAINEISPNEGLPRGGDTVMINGSGFQPTPPLEAAIIVSIGNQPCTNMRIFNDHLLTCTVPKSTLSTVDQTGAVDVAIIRTYNDDTPPTTVTIQNGYNYVATPITITQISPDSGFNTGGTNVTIYGTGFRSCIWTEWNQPALTTATEWGTVTGGGSYSQGYPFLAFDGRSATNATNAGQYSWIRNTPTGWLSWRFPLEMRISEITFYNRVSSDNDRTKTAAFYTSQDKTDTIGSQFAVPNYDNASVTITPSNPVNTYGIFLDVTESYGSGIGANEIEITAEQCSAVNVTFGGVPATYVNVISDTELTATVPPYQGAGYVDVVVSSDSDSANLEDGFEYIDAYLSASLSTPATILRLSPTNLANSVTNAEQTISIATNIPSGFTLQVSAAQANRNLRSTNPNNTQTFTPVSGTPDMPALLTNNTWGFAVPKNQTNTTGLNSSGFSLNYPLVSNQPTSTQLYAAMPEISSPWIVKTTASASTSDTPDSTTFIYAAQGTYARTADNYTANILYTFVPN